MTPTYGSYHLRKDPPPGKAGSYYYRNREAVLAKRKAAYVPKPRPKRDKKPREPYYHRLVRRYGIEVVRQAQRMYYAANRDRILAWQYARSSANHRVKRSPEELKEHHRQQRVKDQHAYYERNKERLNCEQRERREKCSSVKRIDSGNDALSRCLKNMPRVNSVFSLGDSLREEIEDLD